jgi:hypothetical protein
MRRTLNFCMHGCLSREAAFLMVLRGFADQCMRREAVNLTKAPTS